MGRVRDAYDRVAGAYAERFVDELRGKPLDRAMLDVVAEAVVAAGGGVVADLGAGPGQVGAFVRDRGTDGTQVVALDLSPKMATIAHRELGLPAMAGSLTALPLATAGLAGVTAFYTLIHLDDGEVGAALAEIARVLRPGGVVLVAVHIGDQVVHLDEWMGEEVDLDFRFFLTDDLRAGLARAGLDVEAVLERAAGDGEVETRRAYLLARRPPRAGSPPS